MNTNISIEKRLIQKVSGITSLEIEDSLAIEEPLEIGVSYWVEDKKLRKNISVTMRTPGQDRDLALGFLFTEGIIRSNHQVEKVNTNPLDENRITVILKEGFTPQLQSTERNFYTTSSCGVCGKASIDAIQTHSIFSNNIDAISISPEIIYTLREKLNMEQKVFESTGGLHASALFDLTGHFIMLREDVGRHNALDKLIGAAFQSDSLPLSKNILLLSGRASFELIQKSHMAGIALVVAIGAPSSLAVKLAEESNITLLGFVGNNKFNIYTGFDRIRIS